MDRILALALLIFCGSSFASNRPSPFLEQKQLESRASALSAAVFLADGKVVATSALTPDPKGTIQLWNLQTGSATGNLPGPDAGVFSLAASPGGKYLSCGGEGQVVVYE